MCMALDSEDARPKREKNSLGMIDLIEMVATTEILDSVY